MSKLYNRFTKLVFRYANASNAPNFEAHPYHLDYEDLVYREEELVRVIRDALPQFALTPEEYKRLKDHDAPGEMFRQAMKRISAAKKNKKGDYGELLLFLFLKSYYNADRLVTKVKLRSTRKDQIKGFDCAHFTVEPNGEITLWLGEVKFYKSYSDALRDICDEIAEHTNTTYLKNEFSILCPNIECNTDITLNEKITEYLDGTISLDKVSIKIPALITYDAAYIKRHTCIDQKFLDRCKSEFKDRIDLINTKALSLPSNVELFFLLLPLNDVQSIKDKIDTFEVAFS